MFFTSEFKWRRYCDPCDPIVKAEHKARHTKKLNAKKSEVRGNKTFSLVVDVVRTHKEVGELLGITAECVRQTEIKALAKARRAFEKLCPGLKLI
jgi:DNA-directed RNA polymerase sigma subunit (sigma70/sigma32)